MTIPDRAAARAERLAREVVLRKGDWSIDHESLAEVLAELDHQRALIAAVLAACSEAEAVAGWNTARVTVTEIRALLEGEGQ